jgi:hypothetical protein
MGESDSILLAPTAGNPNISIQFEKNDLSKGTARYTAAKQISKNLALKPNGAGRPDSPIAHANVEVHLYDDNGTEVPMTRRLVRSWYIQPTPQADVKDLSTWQIVGLENSEFSPLPVAPGHPACWNFEWDRPGAKDAPGLQGISADDKPFGQLQEFLAGNARVGGVYYQVYVLEDGSDTRVITTNPMKLNAKEYNEVLKMIDSGTYSKTMSRKLFFMPSAGSDDTAPYPQKGAVSH